MENTLYSQRYGESQPQTPNPQPSMLGLVGLLEGAHQAEVKKTKPGLSSKLDGMMQVCVVNAGMLFLSPSVLMLL